MSIDLDRATTHDVVTAYLNERHRRSAIRSLAGKDDGSSTAPSDGVYEQLLGLLRGVPDKSLAALELMRFGSAGSQWQPGIEPEQTCIPVPLSLVARRLSMDVRVLKQHLQSAHEKVSENLAELKHRAKIDRDQANEIPLCGWKSIAAAAGMSVDWCRKWARCDDARRMPVSYAGGTPTILRSRLLNWMGVLR